MTVVAQGPLDTDGQAARSLLAAAMSANNSLLLACASSSAPQMQALAFQAANNSSTLAYIADQLLVALAGQGMDTAAAMLFTCLVSSRYLPLDLSEDPPSCTLLLTIPILSSRVKPGVTSSNVLISPPFPLPLHPLSPPA